MIKFVAGILFFAISTHSALADEVVNYYQSQLVKSGNYQFFAYAASKSADIEIKVRFQSSETRANIATGNIGLSFDTSEGMFYLNEKEASRILKIKTSLSEMIAQAKSIKEDNYESRFDISPDTKFVFSYSKINSHAKIFLHAKMASNDSPFAKMGEGFIELSPESFLSMANAIDDVYSRAKK